MIGSVLLVISALIGGGVAIYAMRDFLVGFFRQVIAPAIRRIAVAVSDIVLTILDLIEGTISYTTNAIRQLVNKFREKVLGIVTNYKKISYNEATVTTETYIMEGHQLRKASTHQSVAMNEIPEHIREKIAERGKVEMHHEQDILNELNKKVSL